MRKALTIVFGAMASSIANQLKDQGVTKIPEKVNLFQRLADSITLLSIHGGLTDGEKGKARKRLMKTIQLSVMKERKEG